MDQQELNFILRVQKFTKSEHFQLYKKIRRVRIILYSIRQNYIALNKSFANFHKEGIVSEFWSNESPFVKENTRKRITTNVLNYLSSASAIIDITRDLSKKELSETKLHEYESLIKEKFVENPEFRFLRKLRNYILHYDHLDVGVNFTWTIKTGKSTKTYLTVEKLLEWNGWTDNDIRFLEKHEKQIDIEPIIVRYQEVFMDVQNQLFINILGTHSSELKKLVTIMEEIYKEGEALQMAHNLPYRISTYRYLKCILKEIGKD